MLIMPLFGNVFYTSGRLKSLPGKGTGKLSGLADVAACIAAPVEFPLVLGSVPKAARRGRPSSRSRQVRDTRRSGCYGRDKDGSYRDKRLDNSGCGGVFSAQADPGTSGERAACWPPQPGSLPGLCRVGATAASAAGAANRAGRGIDTFSGPVYFHGNVSNVTSVTHEAHRFGASVPGPYVCSLAPRWGRPRDWRVPHAARQ